MMAALKRLRQFGTRYHGRAMFADFQSGRNVGQLCRQLHLRASNQEEAKDRQPRRRRR
jgi:hypothetical protein